MASTASASATSEPAVLVSGRTVPGPGPDGQAALPQLFTWPGSSARVSFEGSSSITAVLNGSALPAADAWIVPAARTMIGAEFGSAVFQFELDGEVVGEEGVTPEEPVLVWEMDGLDAGLHSLAITMLSEARYGVAALESITLDPGARFLAPALPSHLVPGRRMLIVGDSIAAGLGNIGAPNCTKSAAVEDALKAFGPLAARELGADFQLLAWSGAGAVVYPGKQFGDKFPLDLERTFFPLGSELLGRRDALDPKPTYNFSEWEPQLVVLALGLNDFHNSTIVPPEDEWVERYLGFVEQVAAAYPSAHLLQLVYPPELTAYGLLGPEETQQYLQYMSAAHSAAQAGGLPALNSLQLAGEGVIGGEEWCSSHPTADTHAALAAQLVECVQGALPGFAAGGGGGAERA